MRQKVYTIFSLPSLLIIFLVAFSYLSLGLLLPNYRLLYQTLVGGFSLHYKFTLIISLLGGVFTALSPFDSWLLIINSLLVGVNIVLMVKAILLLENYGRLHISVGGATIIGLVATGCTSCGLSLIAMLGLSASVSFLPFHGAELHVLSVLFLLGSAIYMLFKLTRTIACKII